MNEKIEKMRPVNWDHRYAKNVSFLEDSAILDVLPCGVISLAAGLPADETFPVPGLKQAFMDVLDNESSEALQYGPAEGYLPLREYLCKKMHKYGVPAEANHVIITNGAQQGLDLVGRLFVDEKKIVCVEGPTYLGALQTWTFQRAKFCTVPVDNEGMRTDKLNQIFHRRRFHFIYALPNFQNPSGVTMSLERRQELADFAERNRVFVIEDDPYGNFRYEGKFIQPIVSLAPDLTFYIGTVSKILAPSLRIGWMVAPKDVIGKNAIAKKCSDLCTSMLVQMAVYRFYLNGLMKDHIDMACALYKERRDSILAEMEKHFPKEVKWTHPEGGLFIWVTVPKKINTTELFDVAMKNGVVFVPGFAFYPRNKKKGQDAFRLNFSYNNPEINAEGIRRLAKVLKQELSKK